MAECIRIVTRYSLDLAVRSGGHALKGSSSTNGFVIDLRRMNRVRIDEDSKIVVVQGGCRTCDIDRAAYEKGLAVVTGVVNDTGMGIALGGGLGWLSGQYGYMVDNIISARVVLADGSIVTTSETDNPDLFWAVRGTGGGFGIVTEFVFKAYEQGPVFAGMLIYPPERVDQCISLAASLYEEEVASNAGKLQIQFCYACPPPAHQPVPLFMIFYNGPESTARMLCSQLYDLGPNVDTTATIPYPTMNTFFNIQSDIYKRHGLSSARIPLPLSKPVLRRVWDNFSTTIPTFKRAWPSHIIFELRDLAAGLGPATSDMAFAGRGNWTNILVHPEWDDPLDDVALRKWATDLTQMIRDETSTAQDQEATVYANYASGDEKSEEIYGANYPRLRELKRKYDPDMVFNKWYAIRPA